MIKLREKEELQEVEARHEVMKPKEEKVVRKVRKVRKVREAGEAGERLRIMFWNVENFFDWRVDSLSASKSDREFSSFGERHWTRKKFYEKCSWIAKVILWAADDSGGLPDIIAFAEVENAFVLRRLIASTVLEKLDYKIVHYDSPDPRGIDVALMYRASRMTLLDSKPCHVSLPGSRQAEVSETALLDGGKEASPQRKGKEASLRDGGKESALRDGGKEASPRGGGTRDILLAHFSLGGDDLTVLVNHHPSKYGGVAVSGPRREAAVLRLREIVDSLADVGQRNVVSCGDFNDTPANPVYGLLRPSLVNLADSLHGRGVGTIRYEGRWELIDMFFVSPSLGPVSREGMRILRIPFLLTRDAAHPGDKPFRTYSGPRYIGGVSDHLPVLLELTLPLPGG